MGSTLDRLSIKEREALARIYDMDASYAALKKLCQYEIDALGKDALEAPNMELKERLHGKAIMALEIPKMIHAENVRINKKRSVEV